GRRVVARQGVARALPDRLLERHRALLHLRGAALAVRPRPRAPRPARRLRDRDGGARRPGGGARAALPALVPPHAPPGERRAQARLQTVMRPRRERASAASSASSKTIIPAKRGASRGSGVTRRTSTA